MMRTAQLYLLIVSIVGLGIFLILHVGVNLVISWTGLVQT
jgi:hypothetical protein